MVSAKSLRHEADYEAALARIGELLNADAAGRETGELDVLTDLVERYESERVEMGDPSPLDVIEFRMDQMGLEPSDLLPVLGTPEKVAGVLSGERPITAEMAHALAAKLDTSPDLLLRKPDTGYPAGVSGRVRRR